MPPAHEWADVLWAPLDPDWDDTAKTLGDEAEWLGPAARGIADSTVVNGSRYHVIWLDALCMATIFPFMSGPL
jgi:hypothetical protein